MRSESLQEFGALVFNYRSFAKGFKTAVQNRTYQSDTPEIVIPEQLDELSFLGSECTYDCSGHRAGYAWYHRNQRDPMSWSPSFNKGAALAKAGK